MASQHPSAPSRASGLIHVNVRHTTRYTVVGNHLAQHRELSLLAIGLAVHLQSLPAGTPVGIKALAAKFPESEMRIAGAMRELEAHGYLKRFNERLPTGRLAPRTISYNRPGAEPDPAPETPPEPPEPPDVPPPAPPQPTKPAPRPVTPAPPPLAQAHRPAAELLARLHLHEPRLLLAQRDIQRLAPGLTTWLERGARPDAVLRTLAASLPDDLVHPAGLLAHRLTALLPPPLPAKPPALDPLQNCDTCDRAFRSAEPGHCRDCSPHERKAA
ncbi:helix-turn-helix domain-containing protein [Streptomyces lateritius]|uniref:helix-turn-helix domain-containing protein n=1 Tax=Streptomyces lateritius TaxID=67313 RepID=UPI001679614B|nr:helix-turn-helix domain-containing protein [Streptomyces lateritius]GGT88545.1 DNA-binding protein [Streptomyces lateritius]